MQRRRRQLVMALLCGLGAPPAVVAQPLLPVRRASSAGSTMPELAGAVEWINAEALTAARLRGKVVLVQFWTYSCINWLRTLPAVRAWAAKYQDKGLVVVGVHTPEFEFEKDIDNVRRATREMNIGYPVAVDSGSVIWRAFGNEYWPALYFVDARGRIRHHHWGEGDERMSEQVIRRLLLEAGVTDLGPESASVGARGVETAADWGNLRSAEHYVGFRRTPDFASPGGGLPRERHRYAAPPTLKLNAWALAGEWAMNDEFAASAAPGARIVYRFHARDLHLVMGPAKGGAPARFRVLVDGHAPGADHGLDTDERGIGAVSAPRLHQLLRQRGPIADRSFEIEFLDAGVHVYSFTFG